MLGQTRLWLVQRISAAVLAICSTIHLVTIIIAVQFGLTAIEITSRVGANIGWFLFYSVFVLASAIHAPIGLRSILMEMTSFSRTAITLSTFIFSLLLLILGLSTIWGFYQLGDMT